jgi:integrase
MAKVEKLKSGLYRTRVYLGMIDGKPIQRTITAPTRQELRSKAAMIKASYSPETSSLTVLRASEAFLGSARATLSPSTVRGYTACFRALSAYPDFMATPLTELTKRDVQAVVDDMCLSGASAKTVRNRYGFLCSALRRYDIAVPAHLPARTRPDIQVPGDSVMREIIEASRGTEVHIPILLASIGGLRRGEICALTLDDIDGNVIHVHADMVYSPDCEWVRKDTPKTSQSNRFVEMPPSVIELIRKQGYICRMDPQSLTKKHKRFLARNGFPDFRLHDYRHHMVSALHAAGVPDAYIMQRGGWSSDGVMKSVYRHTLADHDDKAVQATIAHFEELTETC